MKRNSLSSIEHNGEIIESKAIAGFYLTETGYAPKTKVPRHSHRHACFCLVLQGTYTELYREKTIACKPSHLLFRPAEEVHADYIDNVNVRCFIIEAEAAWLTRLHKYAINLHEPISLQDSSLVWLAMRLRSEAQQPDDYSSLAIEGLMLELVAEMARRSNRISERKRPRWLEQARAILLENFSERMTLAVIAGAVGVHPVYLAGVFRQHYHCSIGEYLRRLRIEFAGRELANTGAPLVDIALAAGFAHQAHFSRTFKRLTGLTPAQYRATFRSA